MLGFFCNGAYTNNEEYKKSVRKRIRVWIGMLAVGVFTFLFTFLAEGF